MAKLVIHKIFQFFYILKFIVSSFLTKLSFFHLIQLKQPKYTVRLVDVVCCSFMTKLALSLNMDRSNFEKPLTSMSQSPLISFIL